MFNSSRLFAAKLGLSRPVGRHGLPGTTESRPRGAGYTREEAAKSRPGAGRPEMPWYTRAGSPR